MTAPTVPEILDIGNKRIKINEKAKMQLPSGEERYSKGDPFLLCHEAKLENLIKRGWVDACNV